MDDYKLFNGDCLEVMKKIPDALCDYIVSLCQKGLQDKMIENINKREGDE